MAPSTTETISDSTSDVTRGQATTSGILSAITEGLTTLQAWASTPNSTLLPPTGENTMPNTSTDTTTTLTSALASLVDVTSEVMSSEVMSSEVMSSEVMSSDAVTTTLPFMTTQEGLTAKVTSSVTTQGGDNVMGALSDIYTVIATTEEPGFALSPMHNWFIATGTVIFLCIILIIVNCCLSNKERLEKTVKDAKHYAAEEKKVRREQNQINIESTRACNSNQTHVFFLMGKRGNKK